MWLSPFELSESQKFWQTKKKERNSMTLILISKYRKTNPLFNCKQRILDAHSFIVFNKLFLHSILLVSSHRNALTLLCFSNFYLQKQKFCLRRLNIVRNATINNENYFVSSTKTKNCKKQNCNDRIEIPKSWLSC